MRRLCDSRHGRSGLYLLLIQRRAGRETVEPRRADIRCLGDRERPRVFRAGQRGKASVRRVVDTLDAVLGGVHVDRSRARRRVDLRLDQRGGVGGFRRGFPGIRRARVGRAVLQVHPPPPEQFRNRHELVALLPEGVDGAQSGGDTRRVEVVKQYHAAVVGLLHDAVVDNLLVTVAPVQGVNAPDNDGVGGIGADSVRIRPARNAHDFEVLVPDGLVQVRLHRRDLRLNLVGAQLREIRVRVGVVRELTAQRDHTREYVGVLDHPVTAVGTAHKEGRDSAARLQAVKERRRIGGGAVVERDGDELLTLGGARGGTGRGRRERQDYEQQQRGGAAYQVFARRFFHVRGFPPTE